MSKVKVYELAKELGKDSKDVVKFLEGKNREVKNHMSTGTAECKADAGTERKTGTGKQAGSKTCH